MGLKHKVSLLWSYIRLFMGEHIDRWSLQETETSEQRGLLMGLKMCRGTSLVGQW